MANLDSIRKDLNPDGRKTKRKVSKKIRQKVLLGPTNNDRTEFKPKFWKRY